MPDIRQIIAAAEAQVREPASLEQREAGNYQKGHFTWCGLGITLESAKGMDRKGVDRKGKAWSVTLKNSYGYIKGTDSAEPGDEMDVFVGDDPEIELVYVVDQNKNDKPEFDEHKCIIGCANSTDAKRVYLDNYSAGWQGFRSVTALTVPQFKAWLENGDMTKPIKGQRYADFCKEARNSNKKKRSARGIAPWLIAPAALGAGGFMAANSLAGDAAAERLQAAVDGFSKPMSSADTPLTRYVQLMSDLANSRPFGVPIGEVLAKARASDALMKQFGIGADYATKTPGSYQDARMHYDAFRKGPVAALYHMMQPEARGGTIIPQSLLFGTDQPDKDVTMHSALFPYFNKAWKDLVKEKLPGTAGWLSPLEVDTSVLPMRDQMEFFERYDKATPPNLLRARRIVEGQMGDSLNRNISNYLPIARALLQARQVLRDVGTTGASAAAGGVLGHYAGRALGYEPDADSVDWGTATGAGLGALAGYLGATHHGRNLLPTVGDKLLSNWATRSKQANIGKLILASLRRGAGVPAGQAFAPTLGLGARRVLKLGLNPELGRGGNVLKRLLQAAGLYGSWLAADKAVGAVGETAGELSRFVPNDGKLAPTNRYLEAWRDSPWGTAVSTTWKGIPTYVPEAQRQLLEHLAVLAVKSNLSDGGLPSAGDVVKKFYSPAAPHAFSGLKSMLGSLVGKPTVTDYGKVLSDAVDVYRQPPVQ